MDDERVINEQQPEAIESSSGAVPRSLDEAVAMVVDWLHLLVDPEHAVELRALKCQTSGYRKPHTRSGFFDCQHLEAMARQALELSRNVSRGVYLTLNPVHRDLLSRRCNRVDVAESGTLATDANITRRRWLLVDADPVRIADVSSTDAEKAAAGDARARGTDRNGPGRRRTAEPRRHDQSRALRGVAREGDVAWQLIHENYGRANCAGC